MQIKKIRTFVAVEMRQETQSYFGFFLKYFWIFIQCFMYGFILKTILPQENIPLHGQSMDYPLFLLSGLLIHRITPFSIRIFDETLSQLKGSGLIEWVLVTPTSLWELFISKMLWKMFRLLTELLALLWFFKISMGTPFRAFFHVSLIQPVFLMFISCVAIGMVLSGISLYLKNGTLLISAFLKISAAFGGVFFPTEVFTGHLKIFSYISNSLPITHALKATRLALTGENMSQAEASGQVLTWISAVLLCAGLLVLANGLAWARRHGEFSKKLYT